MLYLAATEEKHLLCFNSVFFVVWRGCYIFIDLFYFSGKLHDSISQPKYTLKNNSFSVQKKSCLALATIFILTVFLMETI